MKRLAEKAFMKTEDADALFEAIENQENELHAFE
jgi:hypothetical protein